MNIKRSLRMAMADRDVNSKQLAENLGVGPSQVSKWLNTGCITASGLKKLADYFEMPVSEFIKLGE